jgi:predicted ATP-dependent serine protease
MGEVIQKWACTKCGHAWYPRSPGKPSKCPRCQNFNSVQEYVPTPEVPAVVVQGVGAEASPATA